MKKKKTTSKPKRESLVKTKVKADNSIEVELKSPSKSKIGKILVILIVAGMTVFTLFGLIYVMIEVMGK
ncbi:MAG: hypothetical protein PHX62_05350 [Bacilli bacterium]|nr:hypothetical protein [Bacilli bacterium]